MQSKAPQVVKGSTISSSVPCSADIPTLSDFELKLKKPAVCRLEAMLRGFIFNAFSFPLLLTAGLLIIGFGLNSVGIYGYVVKHMLLIAEIEPSSALFWFESLLGSVFVLALVLAMIAPLKPDQPEPH
ncbi:hypothetical protein ACWJJH_05280 [Endozoicomonadaceae bacterium StTr2]